MMKPSWKKETKLWSQGYNLVAGIDEVGRGAWAGPIVAAGVIFKAKVNLKGVNDSKQLSAVQRQALVQKIKDQALAWTIQLVDNQEIDEIGIGKANSLVIDKVVQALQPQPEYLLIDKAKVMDYKLSMLWETIIRGDSQIFSIAAASILAKVWRDELMAQLALQYPQYQFEQHKGYGTLLHQKMIDQYDICPIHRRSYKPISQLKFTLE